VNRFLSSISLLALAAGSCLATASSAAAADATKSTFSVLYSFTNGNDGGDPLSGLIADKKGNLYGATYAGGADNLGVTYRLAPDGTETPLVTFDSANGQSPGYGYLIQDKSGNLFGTTGAGGANNFGAVYSLAPNGAEQVLYSFANQNDGDAIAYGLAEDKNGNFYGTAYEGGPNNQGEVYEVTPGGTKTTLWAFCSQANCTDGDGPLSQLVVDKHGNLYGTTLVGGMYGWGTVFELSPPGKGQTQWTETVLHSFANVGDGITDGCYPSAGVIMDKSGNLYGTTYGCGGYTNGNSDGDGSVYKIAADGSESLLYGFMAGNDGMSPHTTLVEDKDGNLYGATEAGGADNDGTVFEIPAGGGSDVILHTFTGGSDGANPYSGLYRKGSWLYGTASAGGAYGYGTVFKVKD
jgi:uncharacterized repeat protein (TIGR03803 family)